jgi:transketolase
MTEACRMAFTRTLLELATDDEQIFAVTSDARGSVTLGDFADNLPEQFVEIGIAEQNEIGIAAGLASCGKKPFVCAPASFLSARSVEQIKIDIAYSNQNVKIIGVSGGVSYGALGYSHHSLHDIALMRALTGIDVLLPVDGPQMVAMTKALAQSQRPAYVRMGRGPVPNVYGKDPCFKIGKANLLREGKDLTIIAVGELVYHALEAAKLLKEKNIYSRVLDMHTIKPLDTEAILLAAKETGRIVTLEEHSIHGGLGGAVAEVVCQNYPIPMKLLGLPDEELIAGDSASLFTHYGLDGTGVARCVEAWISG